MVRQVTNITGSANRGSGRHMGIALPEPFYSPRCSCGGTLSYVPEYQTMPNPFLCLKNSKGQQACSGRSYVISSGHLALLCLTCLMVPGPHHVCKAAPILQRGICALNVPDSRSYVPLPRSPLSNLPVC